MPGNSTVAQTFADQSHQMSAHRLTKMSDCKLVKWPDIELVIVLTEIDALFILSCFIEQHSRVLFSVPQVSAWALFSQQSLRLIPALSPLLSWAPVSSLGASLWLLSTAKGGLGSTWEVGTWQPLLMTKLLPQVFYFPS